MTSRTWRLHAACHGQDALFFADEGEAKAAREAREQQARSVCDGCPVKRDCLDFALRRSLSGIWAGLGERERADLAAQLGIPRLCPAEEHVLEGDNVYVNAAGYDRCRACRAEGDRQKRARRKVAA